MWSIHDRGAKKWSGIMLPQHKCSLKRLYEQQVGTNKTEAEVEEMRQLILQVMKREKVVVIDYSPEGTIYVLEGRIISGAAHSDEIVFLDHQGKYRVLLLHLIHDLQIMNLAED